VPYGRDHLGELAGDGLENASLSKQKIFNISGFKICPKVFLRVRMETDTIGKSNSTVVKTLLFFLNGSSVFVFIFIKLLSLQNIQFYCSCFLK